MSKTTPPPRRPRRPTSNMMRDKVEEVLATLSPREARILRLRFGLHNGRAYTLEEVGQKFGLTRERIRQIEGKALRRLRHPRAGTPVARLPELDPAHARSRDTNRPPETGGLFAVQHWRLSPRLVSRAARRAALPAPPVPSVLSPPCDPLATRAPQPAGCGAC